MNKMLRQELKKFYKEKRQEDGRTVGRRIHELAQVLIKSPIENVRKDKDGKLRFDTTPEGRLAFEEMQEIRNLPRFRDDFPDFATFKKFIKKNKLTLKDLKDVDGEDS